MLFAAGFGTRMGNLTDDRPKPLISVAGKPLIDHALDLVRDYGPLRIVVNAHYLSDQITNHLAEADVLISHEHPEILETGGGLRHAQPLLGNGPVFTMNTDAIWLGANPLCILERLWEPDGMDALLLCIPVQNTVGHHGAGDFFIDSDGRARRGPGSIYSGLQIIKMDELDAMPDKAFSLNALWDKIMEKGRLHATLYSGKWCDVGTADSIAKAEDMLRWT